MSAAIIQRQTKRFDQKSKKQKIVVESTKSEKDASATVVPARKSAKFYVKRGCKSCYNYAVQLLTTDTVKQFALAVFYFLLPWSLTRNVWWQIIVVPTTTFVSVLVAIIVQWTKVVANPFNILTWLLSVFVTVEMLPCLLRVCGLFVRYIIGRFLFGIVLAVIFKWLLNIALWFIWIFSCCGACQDFSYVSWRDRQLPNMFPNTAARVATAGTGGLNFSPEQYEVITKLLIQQVQAQQQTKPQ